jgi:type I restriction enzyme S subunit
MNTQTFFDHFERLTDAPNAVVRLRELVLQLAVQGRLSTQYARGKRPSERRVSDYVKILNGYAFKSEWFVKDGVRLLRNANVGHGTVRWNDVVSMPTEQAEEFSRFALTEGDIVISLDRPIIATGVKVARISPKDVPSLLLQRVGKVEFKTKEIDPDFFFIWLHSPLFINSIDPGRSNGVPHISSKSIEVLPLVVPPLEEQKCIVAKVDELMRLCDELERAQAERRESRKRLNRAVLDQLLTAHDAAEFQACWQVVSDHFPTLTATPGQIGKLRQTVLQLAVQGKLTRQDPLDEPAHALLRRIRAEKERLAKEKKSRQLELLPPIADDEIPSQKLPREWAWARIGELARFIDYRGNTPPKTKSGVKLITAKNVRMGYINEHPHEYISEETYQQWMTRGFPKYGDVLFTTEAPLGNVAQLLTNEKVGLAQRVIDLQPFQPLFPEYLKICLMSQFMQDAIRAKATGITATGIKAAKLKLILAPVPPLEEQKRIVAAVNCLLSLCDELETSLRRAEEDGERLLCGAVGSLLAPAPENSMRMPALV